MRLRIGPDLVRYGLEPCHHVIQGDPLLNSVFVTCQQLCREVGLLLDRLSTADRPCDGGRVEISIQRTSERGEQVIDASVRDFGPGIPAEHVPRLTERFYRVDAGASRSKRGTGLGLAIVRNILLRHKSRLIVDSVVGQGSTFTARFPIATEIPLAAPKNLESSYS